MNSVRGYAARMNNSDLPLASETDPEIQGKSDDAGETLHQEAAEAGILPAEVVKSTDEADD